MQINAANTEAQANLETEIPSPQKTCGMGSSSIAILMLWWYTQFSLGSIIFMWKTF